MAEHTKFFPHVTLKTAGVLFVDSNVLINLDKTGKLDTLFASNRVVVVTPEVEREVAQRRRFFALGLALIALFCLAAVETALAAADREGQARVLLRSVVSRAAFRQIMGAGLDLPVTLRACPDQSSTIVTYETLTSLMRKQSISYADIPKMRQSLCYAYHEQTQVINSEETRFLFRIPSEHCLAIKELVTRVLDDLSGREFENILTRPLQLKVNQLFTGGRELFPNTSGLHYSPHLSFTVGECASGDTQSILDVTMKPRS